MRHYLSIFEGGKILSSIPVPNGSAMSLTFELFGKTYIALNGGPSFSFTAGFSLFVSCDTQAEIDRYWAKLSDGGKDSGGRPSAAATAALSAFE